MEFIRVIKFAEFKKKLGASHVLQSETKIVGTPRPNAVFSFSGSPSPSQSCLSRFSHQTLYTNIEGTRRHKSVRTILTETVASLIGPAIEKFGFKRSQLKRPENSTFRTFLEVNKPFATDPFAFSNHLF